MKNIFSENVEKVIASGSTSIRLMLEDSFDVIDKEAKEKEEEEAREAGIDLPSDEGSDDGLPPESLEPPVDDDSGLPSSDSNMSPTEKIKALEDQFTKSLNKINSRLESNEEDKKLKASKEVTSILSVGLSSVVESKKLSLKEMLNEKKSLEDKIEKLRNHVTQLDDINDELEKKTKKLPLSYDNKEVFINNIKVLADEYLSGRLDIVDILRSQISMQIDALFEGETGYDLEDFKKECELVFEREVGIEDKVGLPTHIEAVGAISTGV